MWRNFRYMCIYGRGSSVLGVSVIGLPWSDRAHPSMIWCCCCWLHAVANATNVRFDCIIQADDLLKSWKGSHSWGLEHSELVAPVFDVKCCCCKWWLRLILLTAVVDDGDDDGWWWKRKWTNSNIRSNC